MEQRRDPPPASTPPRWQASHSWLMSASLASIMIGSPRAALAQGPSPGDTTGVLKKLSVEELMNLEVTSVLKRPERLLDAPASIFVINAENIRRSGATSLPEILRLAPNLQVARLDPVQYAISARGFNNSIGNKLLVLIDGRTIYTPLFSGVFWEQQDVMLEDIERIEVISGPGATLWGANAVDGVINVITKSASHTQGALVVGEVGRTNRGTSMRWGGTVNNAASYRVYGKFSDWDHTRQASGARILNDWHREQLGARVDWSGVNDTVTLQGDAYRGNSEHRGFAGAIEIPAIEVSGVNLLTRWTRRLPSGSDLQLQGYFDHAKRDEIVLFRPTANIFDLEFQHGIPWRAQKILWGGGYRHANDRVDTGLLLTFIPASRALDWQNLFVQGEVRLSEHVDTTVGFKLEHNDYTGNEYLPSARVAWKPSGNRLVWGAVSRAVRAPSRLDREVFFPANPPFLVVGGPNFQSEVANVFEMGHRAQPWNTLSYSITAFAHVWDKLRSGTGLPIVLENKIQGTVSGVEAWGTYQPIRVWTLNVGLTYLHENLRLESGSTDPVGPNNPNLRNDPDYQWALRSDFDLSADVELNLHLRAVGALPNPPVPSYSELDSRVAWRVTTRMLVAVTGQNLLHSHHPEFGALAGRSEIERNVSGKITWSF